MRLRHSFSSRHTRKIKNIRKQRKKYPSIVENIIQDSDIILEILDARFIQKTRNEEFEEEIKKRKKKIIYVFNKTDLIDKKKVKNYNYLLPNIAVSCKSHQNIKELRDLIKRTAKTIAKPDKITVGVIGYPNTGKSSIINVLIGKGSAGVGSDAGFTKSMQKIKLSQGIVLIDSPGIIPEKEYSSQDQKKLSAHAKLGARSYSQIKEPEMVITLLMEDYPGLLEKHYKINAKGNPETLLEELGKKKGFLKKGGQVNEDTVARLIIKDWQQGNIRI